MAVLRVRGQLREGAVATFAALLISIAASWLLLPPLGLPGAGVGWSLGLAGGMILALYFVRRGHSSDRSRHASDALAEASGPP
jgi:O-antigen/teichoic acid export membrane protein